MIESWAGVGGRGLRPTQHAITHPNFFLCSRTLDAYTGDSFTFDHLDACSMATPGRRSDSRCAMVGRRRGPAPPDPDSVSREPTRHLRAMGLELLVRLWV